MLKEHVSYLTLLCFFNSSVVMPVMAMPHPIDLELNENGEFVFTSQCLKTMQSVNVELVNKDTKEPIGKLKNYEGDVSLKGLDKHSFYISDLPPLKSLRVKLGGALTVGSLLHTENFLRLNIQGPSKLLKGFKAEGQESVAIFEGAELELSGDSLAHHVILNNLQKLVLKKDAHFKSKTMVTRGIVKSFNLYGSLEASNSELTLIDKLTNRGVFNAKILTLKAKDLFNIDKGAMNLDHAHFNVTSSKNSGKIAVSSNLSVTGAWLNDEKGVVTVGQHFQGNFTNYQDAGIMSVEGLASINAERGYIAGSFLARYGMIVFKNDLNIPSTATFTLQDHLTLHTNNDLNLYGNIDLQFRKGWSTLEISKELREKLRGLPRGIFISANRDFKKEGSITTKNASVNLWAGRKYEGDGGITRSGFFEGNSIIISSLNIRLTDEMCSFNNCGLKAQFTELNGFRQIDNLFVVDSGQLRQHERDKIRVGSMTVRADNTTLAGTIDFTKEMIFQVKERYETAQTFQLRSERRGKANVQADTALLEGSYKDVALWVKTNDEITLGEMYKGKVTDSHLKGRTILHTTGSQHHASGYNAEEATENIIVNKGAEIKAKDNILKSRSTIDNLGNIESFRSYLADTTYHSNRYGGKIIAKRATIFSDVYNLNFLSSMSANQIEINTPLNLNAFGVLRSEESLKVNTLLGSFNFCGAFVSSNYTSNSLCYLSYGVVSADFFTLGGIRNLLGKPERLIPKGFAVAELLCASPSRSYFKGAQTLWDIGLFIHHIYKYVTDDNNDEKANYWRASRITQRTGQVVALGQQAYMTYKESAPLVGTYLKRFYNNYEKEDKVTQSEQTISKENQKDQPIVVSQLLNYAKETLLQSSGGNMEVFSIFDLHKEGNLIGHINRKSFWNYDSGWNAAITRNVWCYSGLDLSSTVAYRDKAFAVFDFTLAGKKFMMTDYKVEAGGNITVKRGAAISAKTNELIAGGKMHVEEGAKGKAVSNTFLSRGDMLFEGEASSQNKIQVISSEGYAEVTGKAHLNVESVKQPSCQSTEILVYGEKGVTCAGQTASSVKDTKVVVKSKGDTLVKNAKFSLPGGKSSIIGENTVVEKDTQFDMVTLSVEGKTYKFAGTANLTQQEHGLLLKGDGDLTDSKIIMPRDDVPSTKEDDANSVSLGEVSENQAYEQQNSINKTSFSDAETLQGRPAPPKASVISFGSVHLNGYLDLPNGVLSVDLDKGTNETESSAQPGIILGPHLTANIGGDFISNTSGIVEKQLGSTVTARSIYLNGDKGVIVDGTSHAEESFSAISKNGLVAEKSGSRVTAGEFYNFHGNTFVKEKEAEANAPIGLRHGENKAEVSGTLTAGTYLVYTIGNNPNATLKITDNTVLDTPYMKIGSYPPEFQPAEVKPLVTHSTDTLSQKEEEKIPEERPGPYDDLAPISLAGTIELGKNVVCSGKALEIRGKGITNIPDLMTQTGIYSNFNNKDFVRVHTDECAIFDKSLTAVPNGFELHANQISILNNVCLHAPEILKFHSTDKNLYLADSATFSAGVYSELVSEKDIIGDFQKKIITHQSRKQTVEFTGVTLIAGTGQDYTYRHPETGETSTRKLGLMVHAKGQFQGTGTKFMSSDSDISAYGCYGVVNKGEGQLYVRDIKKEKNKWRTKTTTRYDTEFFMPTAVTGGKILIATDHGGLRWDAGEFIVGQGANIMLKEGNAEFLALEGKRCHITQRKTRIPLCDSMNKSVKGFSLGTVFNNVGNTEIQVWTDKEHDIIAPGFSYIGPKGLLHMKGRKGYFERPVLKNSSRSARSSATYEYTMLAHMKSLDALQIPKDFVHHLNGGDWKNALSDILQPSATFGINWTTVKHRWESLGAGFIHTKNLRWEFSEGIYQKNAFSLNITGEMCVKTPYWLVKGANLHSSSESNGFRIFGRVSSNGPEVGVGFSHSKTKSNKWVYGVNNIATLHADVATLDLDASRMNVGIANGRIDKVNAYTHQDRSKTKGSGVSVAVDSTGSVKVTTHLFFACQSHANDRAGLHIDKGDLRIGKAQLLGASITGVTPESTIYQSLPRGYNKSISGDISIGHSGVNNVNVAASNNKHQFGLSLNKAPSKETFKGEGGICRSIGTISYNNYTIPIVIDVNPESWAELRQDLKGLGDKISNGMKVIEIAEPRKTSEKPISYQEQLSLSDIRLGPVLGTQVRILEPAGISIPTGIVSSSTPGITPYIFNSKTYEPYAEKLNLDASMQNFQDVSKDQNPSVIPQNFVPNISTAPELKDNLVHDTTPVSSHGDFDPERIPLSAIDPILKGSHESGTKLKVDGSFLRKFNSIIIHSSNSIKETVVPFSPSVLEPLEIPIIFQGTTFRYHIPETNCFLEHPTQLPIVLEAHIASANSTSEYVKKAYTALKDKKLAVFYFNGETTPVGVLGQTSHKSVALKGYLMSTATGYETLTGQYVTVASTPHPDDPVVSQIQNHEGAHHYTYQKKGSYDPCHVLGNPKKTAQNRFNLLTNFAEDVKGLSFRSLSTMPKKVYLEAEDAADLMVLIPWEFFKRTFKETLVKEKINLPEFQIDQILKDIGHNFLNGTPPSSNLLSNASVGFEKAIRKAEKGFTVELRPLLTEADGLKPGIVKEWMPKTHAYLDRLEYSRSWRMCEVTKYYTMLTVKYAIRKLPLLDWSFHVGVERLHNGYDWNQSLTDGTLRTIIDMAVNTPVYGGVTYLCGGLAGLTLAGLSLTAEFVSDVDIQEIVENKIRMTTAKKNGDPFERIIARSKREQLIIQKGYKEIFTFPRKASEWLFKKGDARFPQVRPTMNSLLPTMNSFLNNMTRAIKNETVVVLKGCEQWGEMVLIIPQREDEYGWETEPFLRTVLKEEKIEEEKKGLRSKAY